MYTFNYYCFGHKLADDEELNNLVQEYDIYFNEYIDGKEYQVYFPYHGGRGDYYSCVFGTIITDDDMNPNYINEVRNSKEEDYVSSYNKFLSKLLKSLDEDVKAMQNNEYYEGFSDLVKRLKNFLSENEATFYLVEASS